MAKLYYHPEYARRRARWQDYADATDPDAYIRPQNGGGLTSYRDSCARMETDELNTTINRIISAEGSLAHAITGGVATRVIQRPQETAAKFANRLAITVHYLVGDGICDVVARTVASSYGERSKRRSTDDTFVRHDKNATGDGMTRKAYDREMIYWAAWIGACHTLVYRHDPLADLAGGGVSLRAKQTTAGAYLSLVTPLDLISWGRDAITIREWWQPDWSFGEEPKKQEPRFRTITPDEILVQRIKGGGAEKEGVELEDVEHLPGYGIVPMVPMYLRDKSTCPHPIGDGLGRILEPIDRSLLQLGSQRDDYILNACYSLRGLPQAVLSSSGSAVGHATFFGIEPGDPPPFHHAADRVPFDCLTELIAERVAMARNVVGVGRGKAEDSIASRTASEAKFEREDKHGLMRDVLGQYERASNAIDRMVYLVERGHEMPADYGETTYSRAFDGDVFEADIEGVLERVQKANLPPAADLELRKFVGRSVVRRYSEQGDVSAALGAIATWATEQAAAASAPASSSPQPLTLGVEALAAIVPANAALAKYGFEPVKEFEGKTIAEVMAANATTIAAAANAVSGSTKEVTDDPEHDPTPDMQADRRGAPFESDAVGDADPEA